MRAFVGLVLLANTAAAQEAIGLRDAIARSLRDNRDLAREAINVSVADANIVAAEGPFDFVLDASVGYDRSLLGQNIFVPDLTTPAMDDVVPVFVIVSRNVVSYGADVSRLLPSGGNLKLGFKSSRSDTTGSVQGVDFGTLSYDSELRLTLTQPLLRGFGSTVAEKDVHKAEIGRSVAGWRRAARAADILRDLVRAYWEVAFAARDLETRNGSLELAKKQLELTRAEIAAGRLAPVDSLAVERTIAEREEEVVIAENTLLARSIELRRLCGMRPDAGMQPFRPADAAAVAPAEPGVADELAVALRENPSLRAARADGQVRQIDVDVARNLSRPTLDFTGSVGRGDVANNQYSEAVGFEKWVGSAGLVFSYPLGNDAAEAQSAIAAREVERANITVKDLEESISATVIKLASDVRAAAKRIEVTKVGTRLAEQNLQAEQARFSVGKVRNQDVLTRQDELRAAQAREVRAAVDYLSAFAALEAATGKILDRYGVAPR
jgi:outer membrane protein